MPLRAGNIFYFLFGATDQGLIKANTLVAEDVPYAAAPAPSQPYPQALRLRFTLTNPGQAPKVRPLGPGQLEWLPDPGGMPPEPAKAIPANIAAWPTKGTLKLTITDAEVAERLAQLSGLPVVPNWLWYSKVRLTEDFLFRSLAALPRTKNPLGRRQGNVPIDRADWINHAVAGFLKGRYKPKLVAGSQPGKDSLATVAMPEAVAEAGAVELVVAAALNDDAFDGVDANFENPAKVGPNDPAHPRNGAIPARVVYRALRAPAGGAMADAAAGQAIPDRTLGGDPRYSLVRFTRVWQPVPDRSVHFPSQVVQAEWRSDPGALVIQQRLAAHGLLWISLTEAQTLVGREFRFTVTNPSAQPVREMRWLKGETQDAWRNAADIVPVDYDLATGVSHIILRRRMGIEVVYDRRQRPTAAGAACTYFSLRRSVRALVNNRIAGGRLNFESFWPDRPPRPSERRNKPETRRLVTEALGAAADRVLDGRPDPRGAIGPMARSLIPVLERFFPAIVPAQTIGNSGYRKEEFTYGRAAYTVWQSIRGELQDNDTKRNFASSWVGGGGAGALVVTGLAADYAVRPGQSFPHVPDPNRPEAQRDALADRMANAMRTAGLQPGTALQFWDDVREYDRLLGRNAPNDPSGHSPIFLRYEGPENAPTAMWVLDQTGEQRCEITGVAPNRRLKWLGHDCDVWIAASWME